MFYILYKILNNATKYNVQEIVLNTLKISLNFLLVQINLHYISDKKISIIINDLIIRNEGYAFTW